MEILYAVPCEASFVNEEYMAATQEVFTTSGKILGVGLYLLQMV
jgi:hypothetical protein